MTSFLKDSSAVLDYKIDWVSDSRGPWLATGETITAATVTVPTGIVKDSQSIVASTTAAGEARPSSAVTMWLSGGTIGQGYAIVCHITTNQGRQDDRTITVNVRER